MELWSDEVEAMRPEAREAVVASLPPILAMLGREEGTADPTQGMSRD